MATQNRDLPAPFEFRGGPRLVVGPGTLDRLGSLARELGGTRALVTSDPGIVAAGHADAGVRSLQAAGVATSLFSGFGENPTSGQIEAGAAAARDFRPDLLVGLGGGSSMDCAKGINFLLSCGGRIQDYKGRGTATGPMLPSIGVPTTAGTGSETQSFALVTDAATGMKMACGDPRAAFRVAILDVTLTLTQPAAVAALTGIDAVSHAVESHVSRASTPASRLFSRASWRLLATSLPRVFADGGDLEARAAVQLAAAWAGLAIENSMLGAAHALANPLTARHGVPHGQAVGMMLPHVVRFNGPASGAGYAELLAEVGLDADADRAGAVLADRIVGLLRDAGLPGRLVDIAAGGWDAAALAAEAATQWTAGFNPRRVDERSLVALYEAAR